MGLFHFLRPKSTGRFTNEERLKSTLDLQVSMAPKTLDQLKNIGVNNTSQLKLEYFFYTNTLAKAEKLAAEVAKLDYTVQYGVSAGDKKLFIVTGWSTKMVMSTEMVTAWTKQMCELGNQFDCEFDGWGTTPDQD